MDAANNKAIENARLVNITILAEYIRSFAWSPTAWAAHLAHALAKQGHHVTIACDGLENPAMFASLDLIVRRPHRTLRGSDPLGFHNWTTTLRQPARTSTHAPAHATISLTPLAPGDIWMPLNSGTLTELAAQLRAHTPLSALLEVLARPWLPTALLVESRARRNHRDSSPPILARLGQLESRGQVRALGYASRFDPPNPDQRLQLRTQTRDLLGISPDRPVVLLSAVHAKRPGLSTLLAGFASLRRRRAVNPPLLLVMGRHAHHAHRAADHANCTEGLRFLGGTARADAAFAAADLAVAPWSAPHSTFPSGFPFAFPSMFTVSSTGRFIADALRLGVPVLATRHAPGAELIEPAHFGTPELGTILEHPTAHQWQETLGDYLTRERTRAAAHAAQDVSGVVSMAGLVGRIETILGELRR